VVGDALAFKFTAFLHFDAAFIDELLQQLRVVDHLVVAAQSRVLIFDGIETVGAGRHHFLYVVHIEYLNILQRLHLKEELIAGAAGGVTGTTFFVAQNGEINANGIEDFAKGHRDFLRPAVKAAGTAYPKQNFRLPAFCGHFCYRWYAEITHVLFAFLSC
jgi:hypothetical protein